MLRAALGLVALFLAASLLGAVLMLMIPGCRCDSGAGCSSCGSAGGLIELLLFGGFVAFLGSIIFLVPAAALLGFLLGGGKAVPPLQAHAGDAGVDDGSGSPRAARPAAVQSAIERALLDYRDGRVPRERCPSCSLSLRIVEAGFADAGVGQRVSVTCSCGACSGKYRLKPKR
jgi:hypothetical protein